MITHTEGHFFRSTVAHCGPLTSTVAVAPHELAKPGRTAVTRQGDVVNTRGGAALRTRRNANGHSGDLVL